MSEKLEIFPGKRVSPDAMLQKAQEWNLQSCVIVGFDKDGRLCIGSSESSMKEIFWTLHEGQRFMDKLKSNREK
jgi:hypothetical protein